MEMMVMLRLEQRKEIKKEQFHSLHQLEMTEKFLLNKMCFVRFSICCDRVVEDVEAILSP